MTDSSFQSYVAAAAGQPISAPARFIADRLQERSPGSAILIYGSGISVSAGESPTQLMFDYYVIAPSYKEAFQSSIERAAGRLLPPNVYYFETPSPFGVLRAKYAVLSIDHLEKLVSLRTFHSYFWARFAQPMRIIAAPEEMRSRIVAAMCEAISTFLTRAAALVDDGSGWRAIWLVGMNASYKAELRAESVGRAAQLIENYGEWPQRVAAYALGGASRRSLGAALAWRLRAIQGAVLSAARLLKTTATLGRGRRYIAWKIQRHTGVDLNIRSWERRFPVLAAPVVAMRYYRMRAKSSD